MKKRNKFIATFLLFAAVSLGIGYAALTDSFTVHGDVGANKNNENLKCVFEGATSEVDGTYCSWATQQGSFAIDGRTDCELVFQNLNTKGQKAWAKLVVKNKSIDDDSLTAVLSEPTLTHHLNASVFSVAAHWEGQSGAVTAPTIAPGESATLHIVIEMLTTPTNAIDASALSVTFTATTVA